jgi:methylase of polypeptide subunit release factors
MVHVPFLQTASFIGQFLRDSGYDVDHLSNEFDLGDGLYATLENLEPLLARTEGDSTLAVLARLFFVCWPVTEARCRAALPEQLLTSAFDCGLLTNDPDGLASTACLIPFRSRVIGCDSPRTRTADADMVTGPSASTHFLARLCIDGENETTLDLGTGTGALAIEAASYSRTVVGTDVNPRTLQFAEFNAALNGVANIDWRCGDAFTPACGERFTRIIANPPFFLTPGHTFTYCDSPLELDGFTARLARECSAYLEEGGFYQMICEWVELEGESWEQRLRDWTAQSGCDVLVLIAPRLTPLAYAEKRSKESRLMQAGVPEHSFHDRLRYLADRRVRHVIGGVITMRKRSGSANWFVAMGTEPAGTHVGSDVRARFDALTFLAVNNADRIFEARFRLAPDVALAKIASAHESGWQTQSVDLAKTTGLVDKIRLDEIVSHFVPLFDGTNTLAQMAVIVSQHLQVGLEDAQQRCLQLAKRLLQSNFVTIE